MTLLFGEPRSAIVEPAGTDVDVTVTAALYQRTTRLVQVLAIVTMGTITIAAATRFTTSPSFVGGLALVIGWVATTRIAYQLVVAGVGTGLRLSDVRATPRGHKVGIPAVGVLLSQLDQRTTLTAAHHDLVDQYATIGFHDGGTTDRKGRVVMTRPGPTRSQPQMRLDVGLFAIAGVLATIVATVGSPATILAVTCVIAAAGHDLLHLRLPNAYSGIIAVTAIVTTTSIPLAVASGAIAGTIMLVARVGAGDIKYAAAGTMLLTNPTIAAVTAGAALIVAITTRHVTPRPLGPAIAVAIVGALTWRLFS